MTVCVCVCVCVCTYAVVRGLGIVILLNTSLDSNIHPLSVMQILKIYVTLNSLPFELVLSPLPVVEFVFI